MQVSVLQLSPGSDKRQNIEQFKSLAGMTLRAGAVDLLVLPEVWTCLGGTTADKFAAAEQIPAVGTSDGGGEAIAALREIARAHQVFVHGGSIAEAAGEKLLNTSVVIGPDGQLLGRYSKIHLFDVTTPNGHGYRESDTYRAGEDVLTVTLEGRFGRAVLGMAICYDIRFGELFRQIRAQGADLIALPAAFTVETGMAHWEVLLRARAIETQCWMAAAGTVGVHENGAGGPRHTFGHSMIVDPWGTVVAQASSGICATSSRIDQAATARIRSAIPLQDHRRLR